MLITISIIQHFYQPGGIIRKKGDEIMNEYIRIQISNQIRMTETFETACRLACIKDDGQVSREEEKLLKKIQKANEDYIRALSKLK